MKNPDYFPKLNLVECEKIAHRWGKEYPFIKMISLYVGHVDSDCVLIAEVEPNRAANYTRFLKHIGFCAANFAVFPILYSGLIAIVLSVTRNKKNQGQKQSLNSMRPSSGGSLKHC